MMLRYWLLVAAVAFTWTTPDGTVWFADDRARIPARYVDQAREVELDPLHEYRKYTGPVRDQEAEGVSPEED